MDVELAEERILVFADRFTMDHAEGRAWAKRTEAFGTMAKLGGLLNRAGAQDYELVYRERRLQPFWRINATAVSAYERTRDYQVRVQPEVRGVLMDGQERTVLNGCFRVTGLESCREEVSREVFYDGLTKGQNSMLLSYLKYEAAPAAENALAEEAGRGTVVVPPEGKASVMVREVVGGLIGKIEADRVLEERVVVDAVDLYYRPVYAFRYRHAGKEAVIEFDGLTGDSRPGGATFEQYLGKVLEPKFLLDASVEAVNLFVPGTQLARIVVAKGVDTLLEHRDRQ